VLLIDDDTIRTWHRRFQEAGVKSLKDFDYKGSASSLTPAQQDALKAWVTEALPRTTHEIGAWIEREFGIVYESRGGLAALLNRLGLAYRKPSRASSIRCVSGRSSTITRPFSGPWAMTRPRCSSTPSILRTAGRLLGGQGRRRSGRDRLNIHGAIDLETGATFMRDELTINAATLIALLAMIESHYPAKRVIHVFLDNAGYHHAKVVMAWLARPTCRIRLHYIPPYCPHLNPIERL
jgi:hypothetical protein